MSQQLLCFVPFLLHLLVLSILQFFSLFPFFLISLIYFLLSSLSHFTEYNVCIKTASLEHRLTLYTLIQTVDVTESPQNKLLSYSLIGLVRVGDWQSFLKI